MITRYGEDLTEEDVLKSMRSGERVLHSIARNLAQEPYPDEGLKNKVQQLLDSLESSGKIYIDSHGLYREF